MLKAVFFDLDGTLLDTVPDIQACVNASLQKFGYPALDEAHTKAYVGDGAKMLIERALPAGCPISTPVMRTSAVGLRPTSRSVPVSIPTKCRSCAR